MLNQPLIFVGIFSLFPDSTQQAKHIFPGGNYIYHNNNEGLHFGNFVSVDKKRLAVGPIHTSRVTTTSTCLLSCLNNLECISFNFGISAEQGTHLCELLNTDKHVSAENWREDAEFRHYAPKTYCDTMPCQNQGRCVPNYAIDEYKCDCPLHAEGKLCELKKSAMNITCDNKCTVYANGQTLGQTTSDWSKIERFFIPGATKTIAVVVQNWGGPTALLASMSNGKMTDASWRCSSVNTTGWNSAEFDASQWPYAVEHAAQNKNLPWDKVINGISLNAKWIGVANTEAASFFCILKL